MTNSTDPEMCSLIANVCKPPKNFDFPEIVQLLGFKIFHEFVIIVGMIEPITCIVFYLVIRTWGNHYQSHIKRGKQ